MVVYLDDIIIYSVSLKEHIEHLRHVFQVLWENKLYMKLEKCLFLRERYCFLGIRYSAGGYTWARLRCVPLKNKNPLAKSLS